MSTFKEIVWKFEEEVRGMIVSRTELSYKAIGSLMGISEDRVISIAQKFRLKRSRGRKPQKAA